MQRQIFNSKHHYHPGKRYAALKRDCMLFLSLASHLFLSYCVQWGVSEGGDDTKVHQQKLKVTYLPQEGQTLHEEDEEGQAGQSLFENGDSVSVTANLVFSLSSNHLVREQRLDQQLDTGRPHALANGHPAGPIPQFAPVDEPSHEASTPIPPPDFSEEHDRAPEYLATTDSGLGLLDMHRHTPPPPSPPAFQAIIPPTLPEVFEPKPQDDLQTKYTEAQAEIERLRALLAAAPAPPSPTSTTTELRRRHPAVSEEDGESTFGGTEFTAATVHPDDAPIHVEGVPLQVVAIIALAVFITTYLFF
jgi:vesicle-associated membrane protein-associated protein A